jgi:hypothetical protein
MDLRIRITDENGDLIYRGNIYQDGGDLDGAVQIGDFISANFEMDEDFFDDHPEATPLIEQVGEDTLKHIREQEHG